MTGPDELHLREYTDVDHGRTFEWLQNEDTRHFTGTRGAPTVDGHWRWLLEARSRAELRLLSVYVGDHHIGNMRFVDIDRENLRAEIQVYLGDERVRGRGLGTRAMALGKQYAFQQLGLNRLYAFVFDFNSRALRMFASAGFRVEGTLRSHRRNGGVFHDVLVVACLASDE